MPTTAPSVIIPSCKKIKDPLTGLQNSCEFTARLSFEQAKLKVQAVVDGLAPVNCTFEVISNFPPMIRIVGVTIPRDAYSHPVVFKMWHEDAVNGDSEVVETAPIVAVFDQLPPDAPINVTATLVRDRNGVVPDQVRVAWDCASDVDIVLLDDQGKKRTVGSGAEYDAELLIENSSRYGTQDATSHAFRFGVQASNRSTTSAIVYAAPLNLTTGSAAVLVQTPDDLDGTAEYISNQQFMTWLTAQFPAVDAAVVASIFTGALTKIKDIVSKGGSATLSDVGIFKAVWTEEKTAFRNGQYVTVPAVRNTDFVFSAGFVKGTRLGRVMSDTEAAAL